MERNILSGVKPEKVWEHFTAISMIPRCSQNEDGIRKYLTEQADSRGLEWDGDEAGNIAIRVPATSGYENRETVVLQGHMDMVCEKNADTSHNFATDPIKLRRDGDTLHAEGTTLGADNGIALAMGLAVLDDPEAEHGPLELLFTTDEESGLTGALGLDPALIRGRTLINLDSEEEGVFYIGCAGGVVISSRIPVEKEASPAGAAAFTLSITGLKGGHSGANIHEGRGNSLKIGARLLWELDDKVKGARLQLADLQGGGKHNAIPREFFLTFTASGDVKDRVREQIETLAETIREELADIDPDLSVTLEEAEQSPGEVLTRESTATILHCLFTMPHGVDEMSRAVEGLVATSTNLAAVELEEQELQLLCSQRSERISTRDYMADRVTAILRAAGGSVTYETVYPAWTPDPDNPLVPIFSDIYTRKTGKKAVITAIHAGLESGVIGDKFEGMKMISLGPDLEEVHTPKERLTISSVERVWELLKDVLREI
jgi:dipeptidase D